MSVIKLSYWPRGLRHILGTLGLFLDTANLIIPILHTIHPTDLRPSPFDEQTIDAQPGRLPGTHMMLAQENKTSRTPSLTSRTRELRLTQQKPAEPAGQHVRYYVDGKKRRGR